MCLWRSKTDVLVGAIREGFTEIKEQIMASAAANQAAIDALAAQAEKAKGEIVAAVEALKAAADAGQELDFSALTAAVGGLDDLNADAVVPVEPAPVDPEVPVEETPAEPDPAA